MGAVGFVLSSFLPISKLLCLVEIGICAVVYGVAVFAVRAVKREDVLMLPKGAKIASILEKYKLMK